MLCMSCIKKFLVKSNRNILRHEDDRKVKSLVRVETSVKTNRYRLFDLNSIKYFGLYVID